MNIKEFEIKLQEIIKELDRPTRPNGNWYYNRRW